MGIEDQSQVGSASTVFPDESKMDRSADGSEPIRGGSVGFNRILGEFFTRSHTDKVPFADLFLINGMTIFRNTYQEGNSLERHQKLWENDIQLFALYLGAYRVALAGGNDPVDQSQVVIYLPTYKRIPREVRLQHDKTKLGDMLERYEVFYQKYRRETGVLIDAPGVRVVCIAVGETDLPHRELDKYIIKEPLFREARVSRKIVMITHVLLDYFIHYRLPSLVVWESYTAKFKKSDDFGKRLDPSGDIPFNSLMFNLFGDKLLVRCVLDIKGKRFVRKVAQEQKFPMRSESYMAKALSSLSNVPISLLARFNYI